MSTGLGLGQQPRVVYGATTLNFSRPARRWVPITVGIGAGREWAAVPSAWVTRRAYRWEIPLRFTEDEWPSVRLWLVTVGDAASSFTIRPDQDVATEYTVYLVSPAPDDEIRPSLSETFGEFELTVVVESAAGTPIEPVYHG